MKFLNTLAFYLDYDPEKFWHGFRETVALAVALWFVLWVG
jgi:uncharacterized membrane protein YccC